MPGCRRSSTWSATAPTIAPDRGLFLDVTYRMHPLVNDFVSPVFYEGRLETDPSTSRQSIAPAPDRPDETAELGLRFVPVEHPGDATSSRAEASAVADTVAELVGRHWTDAAGRVRPLALDDILIVAPYNAHVAEIDRAMRIRFGTSGRVGTVDKFQGQEGAAAIYSMATSSPDEVPRGVEFLLDGHRFNVAVSRARGLSILVASPELLRVRCRTPGTDAPGQRAVRVRGAVLGCAHPTVIRSPSERRAGVTAMDLRRLTHAAGRLIGAGIVAALITASCNTAASPGGGQSLAAGDDGAALAVASTGDDQGLDPLAGDGATDATTGQDPIVAPATVFPAAYSVGHLTLALVKLTGAFANPLFVANAGDGTDRLFVVEQAGGSRSSRRAWCWPRRSSTSTPG